MKKESMEELGFVTVTVLRVQRPMLKEARTF